MTDLPDFMLPLAWLQLEYPIAAYREALDRPEESTPHFIRGIQWAQEHPEAEDVLGMPFMLHLFGIFALAQFRATSAYPEIIRLCRHPSLEEMVGSIVTSGLPGILASVCGGDLEPLQALIEDSSVDEWVRGSAVESLGVLLLSDPPLCAKIAPLLSRFFGGAVERVPSHVWNCLASLCGTFRFPEFLPQIRECYGEGLVDPRFETLDRLEDELRLPWDGELPVYIRYSYRMIDNAVEELASWAYFRPTASESPKDPAFLPEPFYDDPGVPLVRESPKIGRNDLCPCGTGRKYKKCCGRGA